MPAHLHLIRYSSQTCLANRKRQHLEESIECDLGAGFGPLRNKTSPLKVVCTLSVTKKYSYVYSPLVFAQQTILSSFENTSGHTKELPDSY